MSEKKMIRVDKFLWAVRIYKTRSQATDECKKGRVTIREIQVKPSRIISKEEVVTVRKPPVTYVYRVIEPIENRVSAKLVNQYLEDLTPEEEKARLDFKHSGGMFFRQRGTGRPTKKERRVIDRFHQETDDI
jgi:ribosome-associated heat shock protein Hsp15